MLSEQTYRWRDGENDKSKGYLEIDAEDASSIDLLNGKSANGCCPEMVSVDPRGRCLHT